MSDDWKSKLAKVLRGSKRPARKPPAEARAHVKQFIDDTVLPAFKTLAAELDASGCKTRIERTKHQAVLTVMRDGQEAFTYAVRGRVFHKMTFAFPMYGAGDDEPRMAQLEINDPDGTHEIDLDEISQQYIIDDFIEGYAKWVGWRREAED